MSRNDFDAWLKEREERVWSATYAAFFHSPQMASPLGPVADVDRARHAIEMADRAVQALRDVRAGEVRS